MWELPIILFSCVIFSGLWVTIEFLLFSICFIKPSCCYLNKNCCNCLELRIIKTVYNNNKKITNLHLRLIEVVYVVRWNINKVLVIKCKQLFKVLYFVFYILISIKRDR